MNQFGFLQNYHKFYRNNYNQIVLLNTTNTTNTTNTIKIDGFIKIHDKISKYLTLSSILINPSILSNLIRNGFAHVEVLYKMS